MKRSIVLDPERDICYVDNKYVLNLTAFLSKLDIVTPHLGQLPPVVRYISPWSKQKQAIVIVEGRPHTRTVCFLDQVYTIPVPWFHVVIVLTLLDDGKVISDLNNDVYLSFSKNKLENIDHVFYPSYLYNVGSPYHLTEYDATLGGLVCLGENAFNLSDKLNLYPGVKLFVPSSKTDPRLVIADLKDFYNLFTDILFSTSFNIDIYSSLEPYLTPGFPLVDYYERALNEDDDPFEGYGEDNAFKRLDGKSIEEGISILDNYPIEVRFTFKKIITAFEEAVDSFTVKRMFDIASEMSNDDNLMTPPPIKKKLVPKKPVIDGNWLTDTSLNSNNVISTGTSSTYTIINSNQTLYQPSLTPVHLEEDYGL